MLRTRFNDTRLDMEQVMPNKLLFTVCVRDFASDPSIAEVTNARDLTSGSMYVSQGICSRCHPVTNYCRGHLGKIMLTSRHVSYVYKSCTAKLCSLICDSCFNPINDTSSSISIRDVRLLASLYGVYRNRCNCTGAKRPDDVKPSEIDKLSKIYTYMESTNNVNVLQQLFTLGTRKQVLVNYILVLPNKLLEQIPNGSEILSLYKKLLERCNSTNSELQASMVKSIYTAYAKSLDGKPGLMRQYVLPRKVPNSARAVIKSDMTLGICDVGIPKFMSKAIYLDVTVTQDNVWSVVSALRNGLVSSIAYDKKRYKLVSRDVHIRIGLSAYTMSPNSYLVGRYLKVGSRLLVHIDGSKSAIVFNGNNHKDIMQQALNCYNITEPDGVELLLIEPITFTMLVDVCVNYESYHTSRIVFQQGCSVSTPMENQTILMHRNPVLSAGSMRVHHMRLVDNPGNISMSNEEKHLQRLQISGRRHRTLLGPDKTSMPIGLDMQTTFGERVTEDPMSSIVKYSITSREVFKSIDYEDTNCCISLNPLAISTFQGDFDGDEMNAFSLNHCDIGETDLSLIGDLRRGTFGPTHDAMYGLYCLTNDKISSLYVHNTMIYPNLSVVNFLLNLLEYEGKKQIKSCTSFNNYLCDYVLEKPVLEALEKDYATNNIALIISRFYSDIGIALCKICDHKGMLFDVTNPDSISDIIASGCKPSKSTKSIVYDSIGLVDYLLPDGQKLSYIRSNYGKGVTEEEYMELCYSGRAQVVNKATRTAPEGENMRMQCSYMSSLTSKGEIWYNKSGTERETTISRDEQMIPLCETLTDESVASSSEEYFLSVPIVYRSSITHDCYRLPYRPLQELPSYLIEDRNRLAHVGQRKLLMSEIDFLTDYAGTSKALVVYAGAASGSHINVLLKLFPNITFHLYDTAPFSSTLYNKVTNKPRDGIKLYDEYLTSYIASEKYNNLSNVLFVSDIRTNSKGYGKPSDLDVAQNNATNLEILFALNPVACMLKFRLPYNDNSTAFPVGEIRLQCWADVESTETRLVCTRPYTLRDYSHRAHEQVMYCHNLTRPYAIVGQDVFANTESSMRKLIKHKHYDVYRETQIISKYIGTNKVSEAYTYECINDVMGSGAAYVKSSAQVLD